MTLDRSIALLFLLFCAVYGYHAWFGMDQLLPPILKRAPVWPSSFPKILSIVGAICAIAVLVTSSPPSENEKSSDIELHRLWEYNVGQAALLILLMLAYAFLLRPAGFITSTTLFLAVGGIILGERKFHIVFPVAIAGAFFIWYLVQELLGIFLRPWPLFLT